LWRKPEEIMKSSSSLPAQGDLTKHVEPVVHIAAAAVRLGGQTIWEDVNLDVQSGEFIAILGPNGSGKSTLVKAVLGLISLSAGTVTVFGQPARRGHPDIGYVPQRRTFDADVRIRGRDIVRLGLDGGRWGPPLPFLYPRQAKMLSKRVDDVIESVDAGSYADRPIGEMSGGQQQRLLIAQALVTDPRMLVLDEPLDSLDLANQRAIAGIVRGIARETGAAVLLVAHDINPIMPWIDRVVYIARGHVAVGTPAEVITSETLSRLYDSPVEVLQACDGGLVVVGHPGEECVSYHVH
jgi:zinc/manganese transport system ATP-binding protein